MKRGLIILILLCAPAIIHAQSTYFNNFYNNAEGDDAGMSIIAVDTGYFIAFMTIDTSGLGWDLGIMFIDTLGNEIWVKKYESQGNSLYAGLAGSLTRTQNGNFALGGSITYADGDQDAMLWRFDGQGDTLWTKTYRSDTSLSIAYSCKQTLDGGFALSGTKRDTNAAKVDIMLLKTDSLGNKEWEQTYGGFPGDYGGFGEYVDVCNDGSYIIGGGIDIGNYDFMAHLIKVDTVGTIEWDHTFIGPYFVGGATVQNTSDGGYIAAMSHDLNASTNAQDTTLIRVAKLDSAGNVLWDKIYDNNGMLTSVTMVRELNEGGYIVGGNLIVRFSFGGGGQSGFLLKLNDQGDSLWYHWYRKCFSDASAIDDHYFLDVQPTNDGGYVAAGRANLFGSSCNNVHDVWVVKVDSLGLCPATDCDYQCNFDIEYEIGYNSGLSVSFSNTNVVGLNYWDFGDGNWDSSKAVLHIYDSAGTYVITHQSIRGPCIKTVYDTVAVPWVGIDEITENNEVPKLKCFPNPFSDYTTIAVFVPKGITRAKVLVFNTLGVTVKEFIVREGHNALTLWNEDLPVSGVYFLQVSATTGILTKKVVLY